MKYISVIYKFNINFEAICITNLFEKKGESIYKTELYTYEYQIIKYWISILCLYIFISHK